MAANPPSAQGMFSDVLGAAIHKATVAAAPHVQAAADERVTAFLEGLEARVAPLIAPFLEQTLNDPDTPPAVRDLLAVLAEPSHKFDSSLVGIGLAAILYPFLQALLDPSVTNLRQDTWRAALAVPGSSLALTPAEAALAVIKNTAGTVDPATEAAKAGLDAARFDVMVANTGEPPGIAELLLAYRRNLIDVARLEHGIRQSRVRDEWQDVILALRFAPPPAGEVVAGRVKEHLDDATYRTKLSEAGIDPTNAEWMRLTAGRPYGIEQALHLFNRGAITESRVREVVAQSDINTDFFDDILQLRFYIPPVRSIMAMLRAGAIDDAQATTLFAENGVRAADIPGYLAEAHHTKATTAKQLSEAQTLRMYGAKFIDRPTATGRLARLGYDQTTIGLLLDFADEAQHERFTNAVVTRIHARFVAYKITAAEATTALTADGIPAAAQTDLLKLWQIERDANIHVLTPASITAAYRRKQIGPLECKQRLLAIGVQPQDLAIIVADAYPPTKPDPTAVQAVIDA